jgi:phosphatidylserine/phosphatidylglycerophosphate/cardiolipin synthase-like enzyme
MARRRKPTPRTASPGNVLIALLLLLVVYLYQNGTLQRWWDSLTRGGAPSNQPALATPAPAGAGGAGDMQVFFTTTSLVYPDVRNRRPVSPLLQTVIADIDGAQKSVDLATFDFDIPEVTDALIRAKQRGAAVRLIVDSENLETPEVSKETGRLQSAGIPVHFDDREPFMHNKFLVVDDEVAWTGSWNVTTNDTFRNNNNWVRFANALLAANYTREFEQMFDGRFGSKKSSGTPYIRVQIGAANVEVYYSPEDGVAKYVVQRLKAAKTNIRFMAFSYTADDIADVMIAQKQAGLVVQGVFEKQNAAGSGAEYAKLKSGGIDVLQDGNCYILHHKVIIIDERTVITGSYNFTGSAERDNDENLVIVDDPALARSYLDEFNQAYAQAQTPTRCG